MSGRKRRSRSGRGLGHHDPSFSACRTGSPTARSMRCWVLALVLVFAVTRVILIPQGEFVTFGALTYALLAVGKMPGTVWLAVLMGAVAFVFDLWSMRRSFRLRPLLRSAALYLLLPLAILALTTIVVAAHDRHRDEHHPVADHRRAARALSLSHRLSADGRGFGADAADRLGRRAFCAARSRPRVLRTRRLSRPGALVGQHRARAGAGHRAKPRRLWRDRRPDRRALAVLRLHALRQGAARHRRQPHRRAPVRHSHLAVGPACVSAGGDDRRRSPAS